jgi:hypothetical protein
LKDPEFWKRINLLKPRLWLEAALLKESKEAGALKEGKRDERPVHSWTGRFIATYWNGVAASAIGSSFERIQFN